MCKGFSKILQQSWLFYLGWFLWLGAYSQLLGAKTIMREIIFLDPQLMYWVATIGTCFILAMIALQFIFWVKSNFNKNTPSQKQIKDVTLEELKEIIQKVLIESKNKE